MHRPSTVEDHHQSGAETRPTDRWDSAPHRIAPAQFGAVKSGTWDHKNERGKFSKAHMTPANHYYFVSDGELVVSGCDGAMSFEPFDAALHKHGLMTIGAQRYTTHRRAVHLRPMYRPAQPTVSYQYSSRKPMPGI